MGVGSGGRSGWGGGGGVRVGVDEERSYCENSKKIGGGGGQVGGQGGCERRSEVFVKIKKKKWGGGGGGGRGSGQGGSEQRNEVFVKIRKKIGVGWGVGSGVQVGGSGWMWKKK